MVQTAAMREKYPVGKALPIFFYTVLRSVEKDCDEAMEKDFRWLALHSWRTKQNHSHICKASIATQQKL